MQTMLLAEAVAAHSAPPVPPAFFPLGALYGLLCLGGFLFFHFNRNAALKRRVWPVVHIITGVLFIVVCWFGTKIHQPDIWFMVPAIALITFLNIRSARFCDTCGRTSFKRTVFSRLTACRHCGAPLASK